MPRDVSPDYIVIGAGSSGCVIASRLSANPHVRVLLIEAGGRADADDAVATPGRWTSLMGSAFDWNYATPPEPGMSGRSIAVPRGRALGGSSTINAMVHIRGHRVCFDAWHELGNPGWSYDDLLPLFKRSERCAIGAPEWHGTDGPLVVGRCTDPHAGHHAFLRAADAHGFPADADHDFNAPEPEGVAGLFPKNILNGRRHSAAAAFLAPVLGRPNLEVLAATRVTKVTFEGTRASGVEYVRDDQPSRVRAAREVVIAAGAVDSPRLLLLSGVGPAGVLRRLGIPVVADRPGVGANLQDHLKLSIRWRGKTTLPGSTVTAGLFLSTTSASPPDVQFYVGRGLEQPDDLVTITVSVVRTRSRGSIALASGDPFAPPLIRVGYLQEPADVDALRNGLRLARELGRSRAYDHLRGDEVEPGAAATDAADLERFIRAKADSIYHVAGTCRMGPASDARAVVDAALRVHGLDGVRVADASIMPELVGAPPHAACVAIGEKCAALLGADA